VRSGALFLFSGKLFGLLSLRSKFCRLGLTMLNLKSLMSLTNCLNLMRLNVTNLMNLTDSKSLTNCLNLTEEMLDFILFFALFFVFSSCAFLRCVQVCSRVRSGALVVTLRFLNKNEDGYGRVLVDQPITCTG
jgi:hypothetical protein